MNLNIPQFHSFVHPEDFGKYLYINFSSQEHRRTWHFDPYSHRLPPSIDLDQSTRRLFLCIRCDFISFGEGRGT